MRLTCVTLALATALGSSWALAAPRVAVPPPPDLVGTGSSKELTRAVGQALAAAHVRVASPADLRRASKALKLKAKARLTADQAGRLAARGGFTAVVIFRKAAAGAFAQLVDAHGQVTLERLVHLQSGVASDADAAAFGAAVAEALSPPPPPPPVTPGAAGAAVVPETPGLPPAPIAPAPGVPQESPETASALAGPEVAAPKPKEPAAGYYLRIGVMAGAAERRFLAPAFSYVTNYPYAQGGVSLELFPFRNFGLGLVGDFTLGQVKDQVVGGPGTFTSTDLRVDAALAYRLRLFSGPFGTFLIPRVGFGLRDFDAPASSSVTSTDRLFFVGGLSVTQPLVARYLRVSAGVAALPFSKFQKAAQTSYGTSSSFGLEWLAELGGDVVFGLEWALQVEQERFMDSYSGPPGASGIDVYTDYTLQLRYRF